MSEEDDRATARLEVCLKDFWLRLHTQFPQVTWAVIQCSDCLRPPSVLPPEIFKKIAVICNQSTEVILSLLDVPDPAAFAVAGRGRRVEVARAAVVAVATDEDGSGQLPISHATLLSQRDDDSSSDQS